LQFSICVEHSSKNIWPSHETEQECCSACVPGVSLVVLFSFFKIIALEFLKYCNFQLVSHVAQKVFDLGSWNFTGMLISMWSCAPVVFHVDFVLLCQSYCPWLWNFLQVSICLALAQEVFNKESWNLTGMLVSMCTCAPGVSLVD
jgi:hypothetical protein